MWIYLLHELKLKMNERKTKKPKWTVWRRLQDYITHQKIVQILLHDGNEHCTNGAS